MEREEEGLLARRDCSATQVAWILVALWGGNVGVRGGERIDDGYDGDGRASLSQGSADGRSMIAEAMREHTPRANAVVGRFFFQGECAARESRLAPEANVTPIVAMRPFRSDANDVQQYAIRLR